MSAPFQMEPSPYHLGECNLAVPDPERPGQDKPCGQPAIERWQGRVSTPEFGGDVRRCVAHLSER